MHYFFSAKFEPKKILLKLFFYIFSAIFPRICGFLRKIFKIAFGNCIPRTYDDDASLWLFEALMKENLSSLENVANRPWPNCGQGGFSCHENWPQSGRLNTPSIALSKRRTFDLNKIMTWWGIPDHPFVRIRVIFLDVAAVWPHPNDLKINKI